MPADPRMSPLETRNGIRKILNVGGNDKRIPLPGEYRNWEHLLLDIDPDVRPDIVCDARDLTVLPANSFDAIYCAHNLEHYYRHEITKVLGGFRHLLKHDGFADISVPDIGEVFRTMARDNLDVDSVLYHSPAGLPITVADVIWGFGAAIQVSGHDYFAHKMGFTEKSLRDILIDNGFKWVFVSLGNLELRAIAFVNKPSDYAKNLFNLPSQRPPAAESGPDA